MFRPEDVGESLREPIISPGPIAPLDVGALLRMARINGNPLIRSRRQKWSFAAKDSSIDGVMPPNAILGP